MTTTTSHGQVPEALTYERGRAIMEGERNASLDGYSRVVLLTSTETAFTNGWNQCAALHTQQPASPTPQSLSAAPTRTALPEGWSVLVRSAGCRPSAF